MDNQQAFILALTDISSTALEQLNLIDEEESTEYNADFIGRAKGLVTAMSYILQRQNQKTCNTESGS